MHHGYIYYCSGINHTVQSPWRMVLDVGCCTVHYSSAAALRTRLTLLLSSPDLLLVLILQKHPEALAEITPALLCWAFTLSGKDREVGGETKRWSDLPEDENQFTQEVRDERGLVWKLDSHTGRDLNVQHLLQLSVGLLARLSANSIPQFSPENKSASKQNEFAPTYIGTEGHILRAFCLKPVFSIFLSQPTHNYITCPI